MLVNRSAFFKVLALVVALFVVSGCEPDVGLGPSVDINPPVVSLTSHALNDYIRGTVILGGSSTDDQGVKSVTLTIDGIDYHATVSDTSWSLSLDTSSMEDGKKQIMVNAVDKQDKTAAVVWGLNVDNTPPVVLLSTPSLNALQLNDRVQFTGSAYDNIDLVSVNLTIATDEATPRELVDVIVDGLSTWNYSFDSNTADAGSPFNGDCIVTLTAIDAAGNQSVRFYHEETLLGADSDIKIAKSVFLLENGLAVTGVDSGVITPAYMIGTLAVADKNYAINQTTDLPVVTLDSFPVSGSVTFHTSNKLRLEVTDDDLLTQVQYSLDGAPLQNIIFTPSKTMTWEYPLSVYSSDQGTHTVRIVARDNNDPAKVTDTGDRNFVADAGSPNLTITDQPTYSGSHQSGAFTLSGTASDGSSVDRVEIVVGAQTFLTALTEVLPQNYTWTYTLDPVAEGLAEGEVEVIVRAVDEGSNATEKTLPMTIDLNDPEVFLAGPSESIDQNGLLTVRGTADDNFQIDRTQYSINGGVLQDFANSYTWEHTLNTTDYDDVFGLGTLNFLVRVTDKSGRFIEDTFTYDIDQSTDKPEIAFGNLDVTPVELKDNALPSNLKLSGTIEDDDSVDASSLQFSINGGAWTDVFNVGNPAPIDNATISWSFALTDHGMTTNDEGVHTVALRVYDTETSSYVDPYKAETSDAISFIIDKGPPSLYDVTPAGSSYQNGDFTITGKANDSMGVDSVLITIDGIVTNAPVDTLTEVSPGVFEWTYFVDVSVLGDGVKTVTLTAEDTAGKTAFTTSQYFVDTVGPTVLAADILPADGALVNGITMLQGSASDPSSIGKIISVEYSFGNTDDWTDISDDGLYSWKVLNLSSFNYDQYVLGTAANAAALAAVTGMVSGDYYKITSPPSYARYDGLNWQPITTAEPWPVVVKIRATDGALNQTVQTRNLVIDQTADAPIITLSNLNAAGDADDNLLETNPRILGLVVDDDGINSGVNAQSIVEISFDYNGANEGTATWTPVTVNGTGTNVSWSYNLYSGAVLIPAVTEGVNNFSIRVRDIIIGTAGDTGYNKTITGPVEFAIDLAPPVIAISAGSINTGSYLNAAGGDLIFTVTEPNRSAMVLEVNGSSVGITPTANANEYMLTVDTSSMSEGQNNLIIRAVDNYGKTTEKIVSLTYDNTAPDISLNNLTGGTELNGNIFTLSGSIDESYGLDTAGYPITARIYLGAVEVASGVVTSTYSWTYAIDMDSLVAGDTTGLADNQTYTITISARDNAGNVETTAPVSFSTNQSKDLPNAVITNLAASDSALRAPTVSVIHSAGKEILAGVLYSDSAINTAGVTLMFGGVNRTSSVVFQGSGTVVPFYLDLTNSTTYPDNIYTVSMTVPGGVNYLYDIIGNNIPSVTTNSKFLAQVEDDDAVHTYTITVDTTEVVSSVGNTAMLYNPSYTVPVGLASGIHLIKVTAVDPTLLSETTYSLFIKDTGAPVVTISSPTQGAYVNDDVSTTGTVTDDYSLKSLSIMAYKADTTLIHDFGTTATWTKTDNQNWSWNFTLEALPDIYSSESVTLEYTATDFVGGQSAKQRAITVDNLAPSTEIRYPAVDETLNGAVVLKGSANDAGLDTVRIRIGYYPTPGVWQGSGWLTPDGLYSWTYSIPNVVNYANRLYAEEQFAIFGSYVDTASIPVIDRVPGRVYYLTGTNTTVTYTASASFQTYYDLWESGMEVQAADKAGNVSTQFQAMKIDANSDRPIVTVVQPTLASTTQGGTILVFGTARDDDGLDRIEARVDVSGDGNYTDIIDLYNGTAFVYDGDTSDPFENENLWYPLSGTDSWTLELNKFGELYSRPDHAGDGGLDGLVRIRIRAVDINGVVSNEVTRTVSLDNTVPIIEGLNYLSGDYVHGSISLHADITDDALGGIKNISVSYNNGANFTDLYVQTPLSVDGSITVNTAINMDLDLPLETTNASSPAFIGSSDILYLVIRVTDTSNYQSFKYVYLNVDNQLPSANLKLDDPVIFNPYDIIGEEARIYGHASDVGTISGLERIIVYVTDADDNVYDVENGGVEPLADPTDYLDVLALNDYSTPGSEEVYAMVVNDMNEYGEDIGPNGDDDLIDEYITAAIGGTDWWLLFNSENIPDGEVTIHYVVEDAAGNINQYSQNGIVANNKPVFVSTLIGDDIDRNGTVATVEKYPYPVTGTRPGIVEELEVSITMDKACLFEVFWGDLTNSIRTKTVIASSTFIFNEDSLGTGFDYTPGTHDFFIQATDSNGVLSLKQITVVITDADTTDPVLQIFPLTETYVDGREPAADPISNLNDDGQTRPVLVDPMSHYNGVYQGHLEFVDYSVNDTIGQEDADVSGIVTLRGYVYDNRGLKAIAGTISGFNAGAARDLNGDADTGDAYESNVLAYWDPAQGKLVSNLTNFAADYEEFTISSVPSSPTVNYYSVENQGLNQNGHVLYWTYKWDSSRVTNVAAANVLITFTGIDFFNRTSVVGATPLTNTTDGYEQFDVVPYITGITTPFPIIPNPTDIGLKDQNIRTSSGQYTIKAGNTDDFILLAGYNLSPIANGVRLNSLANRLGVSGTTLLGNTLAFNAPTNGYKNITLSNNTTNSGYLGFVGGTAGNPVPALNNVNNDTLASNKEPDRLVRKNLLFNDDRFLKFFTVTNTSLTNAFFPNMVMVANTPNFGYVQSGAADDLQVRRGTTSASNTPITRILSADQMAMTRDTGGRFHMVSVNNFSGGRMVYFYNDYATNYTTNIGNGYTTNNGACSPYWSNYPAAGNETGDPDNNAINLDSVNYTPGLQLSRYQRPVIRTIGDSTTSAGASVYLAYYDSFSGELLFRSWKVGDNLTDGTVNLYGTYDATLGDRTVTTGDTTRKLVTTQASEYFDMAVTSTGIVVIAYYNQTTSKLTIRYSATADNGTVAQPLMGTNPAAAVYWSSPVTLDDDPYVGWYPSMAIHTDGTIHIAAYDSSGADLSYIYMTAYDDTDPEVVTVDSFNSVGYYTDIKLLAGIPYIAYYSISDTGTRDSVRLAWYKQDFTDLKAGVDANGYVTGDWETLTVPVGTIPKGSMTKFLKVNLGFTSPGNGNIPTISYAADTIEYSQPLPNL